ncbi:unnamed protein product [Staurois parvus]|uniref:Uncharacterized protein n=1 Tax=Staurois parvus TaxID=386267 RepID=A0ABN9FKD9_9NEOB|nr:unnamed protein product [Staurois parvus]
MWFDPDFSDPPLLPVCPSDLLIRHIRWRHCICSIWCVLLQKVFFFFFSRESACDQHRANQYCPDRGHSSSRENPSYFTL